MANQVKKPQTLLTPLVFLRPTNQGTPLDGTMDGKNSQTPKNSKKPIKLAILVSKKNFKTAILRNKAKRAIKEAARAASKDLDMVFGSIPLKINAQKSVLDVQFLDLVEIIKKELKRRI